jgi:hypothetical protein
MGHMISLNFTTNTGSLSFCSIIKEIKQSFLLVHNSVDIRLLLTWIFLSLLCLSLPLYLCHRLYINLVLLINAVKFVWLVSVCNKALVVPMIVRVVVFKQSVYYCLSNSFQTILVACACLNRCSASGIVGVTRCDIT